MNIKHSIGILLLIMSATIKAENTVPIDDHPPRLGGTLKPSKVRAKQNLQVILDEELYSLLIINSGASSYLSIRIINEDGEIMITNNCCIGDGDGFRIDLSSLDSGTYDIEIEINGSLKYGTFELN